MADRLSVIIPARDEAANIERAIRAVLADDTHGAVVEIIVVDAGSVDDTVARSEAAGARVVSLPRDMADRNPALSRNRGAAVAVGDRLIFLDADCEPQPGWLAAIDSAHEAGARIVGGSFELPPGLTPSARCDYYAGWYHAHAGCARGPKPSTPPGNLSVDRDVFRSTSGFDETPFVAYSHEELRMQAELARAGFPTFFEPSAVVTHRNRPGLVNLLKRNYRWGYSALESKTTSGAARFRWVYRSPAVPVLLAFPLALPTALYICTVWARNRRWEAVAWFPLIFAARVAWSTGMFVGGARWLVQRRRRRRTRAMDR
ncbi:MAG: glycosyltransferase [Gemmatimonadota bacterium]